MIINTGARTDTVNYYSDWLLNRFKEGFCFVKNPMYPNHVSKYMLNPKVVDCVVFCSKNFSPILPRFHEIYEKFHVFCYYTITAFDKDIEPNVPDIDSSIEILIKLSKAVGKNRVAWRFDPLMITKKYTKEYLLEKFDYIASKINNYISFVEFSFIEMYKHIEDKIPDIKILTKDDKQSLAIGIAKISKKYNLNVQTCGKADDYTRFGIGLSGCITPQILESANPDLKFKDVKCSGLRVGCGCMPQRDIGEYNTCLNMCKYCYANTRPELVLQNYKKHNKNSPILIGELDKNCLVAFSMQKSFLVNSQKTNSKQLSLLDKL